MPEDKSESGGFWAGGADMCISFTVNMRLSGSVDGFIRTEKLHCGSVSLEQVKFIEDFLAELHEKIPKVLNYMSYLCKPIISIMYLIGLWIHRNVKCDELQLYNFLMAMHNNFPVSSIYTVCDLLQITWDSRLREYKN